MSEEQIEPVEEMASFFDLRSAGYDAYIRGYIYTEAEFLQFYQALAAPIEKTEKPIQILDLGCGTGLEIEFFLKRAPNAQITGVDLSRKMLEELQRRYATHMGQITLVAGSYLTLPFGEQTYDYVLSAMTMHHLLHDAKRGLYEKIHAALKPGGKYVEGDSVTRPETESQFLAEYNEQVDAMPAAEDGHYHVDVPLSLETQKTLLMEAGFSNFELLWQKEEADVWNAAVYVVTN